MWMRRIVCQSSIWVTSAGIIDDPGLVSSQEECDTWTMQHAIFIAQQLGAERVVVYWNDTDIVVMLVYYTVYAWCWLNG